MLAQMVFSASNSTRDYWRARLGIKTQEALDWWAQQYRLMWGASPSGFTWLDGDGNG
jgi:hypothetical protein